MPKQSILVVETDLQLSVAFELFFKGRAFAVRVANSASEAMQLAATEPSDLCLIGNLPDSIDAGTLGQRLRACMGRTQIVILSHAIDIANADLVIPNGAHPRAILDGIRTLARRRTVTRPVVLDEAG